MCKNYDADVPNQYPTVGSDNDYEEVSYDAPDTNEYYDLPRDLIESIGQAIIDASESEDRNEESSIYSSRTESSDGGDDDDN